MGTCEFVVRLLARVTGEKRGARYVWHKMLVAPFLKKKNICRRKKISRRDFGNKNKIQYSGYGSWTVVFSTKQRWRCDVHGGHGAENGCAAHVMRGPRSCSVVSAGDLSGP